MERVNRESVEVSHNIVDRFEREMETLDGVINYDDRFRYGEFGDPARYEYSRIEDALSELRQGKPEKAKKVLDDMITKKQDFLATLRTLGETGDRKDKIQRVRKEIKELKSMRAFLNASAVSNGGKEEIKETGTRGSRR